MKKYDVIFVNMTS